MDNEDFYQKKIRSVLYMLNGLLEKVEREAARKDSTETEIWLSIQKAIVEETADCLTITRYGILQASDK
jgi:hypothetical protein